MEFQRAFPIFPIHLRSVPIFMCTVGLVYSVMAILSASSAYANYTTDLSVPAYAWTSASFSYANNSTDLSVSAFAWTFASSSYANCTTDLPASTGILLLSHYATSASISYGNKNVFVNHYWPDVGKNFASHLSRSLISHGLRVGTIDTASVHIAIFSKNYAKSSCCLNELMGMLKSGAPIIPVFYDVKPSDLRCYVVYARVLRMFRWTPVKNGALYCEDLCMLEEEKTITEWRKALFDASRVVGFERVAYNGDEGQLVHNVVKRVLSIKRGWSIEEPKTPIQYDVFINHRGTDVKNTLASHLYYRLRDDGLRVFFDKEEAKKGHTINSEIKNAIKVSSVHIAIFSSHYAESEWCNDELVLMVESEAVIIPVFYDVKPTDIWGNQVDGMNGVYAKALLLLKEEKIFNPKTHQEKPRYDPHTIEIWEKVLMEVTGRDGFELETYDGDEGLLVDDVVRVVKTKVKDDEAKDFESKKLTAAKGNAI